MLHFPFLTDPAYGTFEWSGLIACLMVAIAALAGALLGALRGRDTTGGGPSPGGTGRIDGADSNLLLRRQLAAAGALTTLLGAGLVLLSWPWDSNAPDYAGKLQLALSRGIAFVLGSMCSAAAGLAAFRLTSVAWRNGPALDGPGFARHVGRGGFVTGLVSDGLGLLGGCIIFLWLGDRAFEALLGFAFGATVPTLLLRVGGGIVQDGIARGALARETMALAADDRVPPMAGVSGSAGGSASGSAGAGLAADLFESCAITVAAAMILGYACLGLRGAVVALLLRAAGVVAAMAGAAAARPRGDDNVRSIPSALRRGFWLSTGIGALGLATVTVAFAQFDSRYIMELAVERGLHHDEGFQRELTQLTGLTSRNELQNELESSRALVRNAKGNPMGFGPQMGALEKRIDEYPALALAAWRNLTWEQKSAIADAKTKVSAADRVLGPLFFDEMQQRKPYDTLGKPLTKERTVFEVANALVPVIGASDPRALFGADWRVAAAGLIGIASAIALRLIVAFVRRGAAAGTNLARRTTIACTQAAWVAAVVAGAVLASTLVFSAGNWLFSAFGVSVCGLGLLSLAGSTTGVGIFGNTFASATQGPIATDALRHDSASDPARLAPLDVQGGTGKEEAFAEFRPAVDTGQQLAEMITIGAAAFAALALLMVAVVRTGAGSGEPMFAASSFEFLKKAETVSVFDAYVLFGLLAGALLPFLFGGAITHAADRLARDAASEGRRLEADEQAGTQPQVRAARPRAGPETVVAPTLLAVGIPILVGFALGADALAGVLIGALVAALPLAVFLLAASGETPTGFPGSSIGWLMKIVAIVCLLALPLATQYNVAGGSRDPLIGLAVLIVAILLVALSLRPNRDGGRAKA